MRTRAENPFGEEWYDEVVLAATTLSSQRRQGRSWCLRRNVGLKPIH
jgi:hypothetical protein